MEDGRWKERDYERKLKATPSWISKVKSAAMKSRNNNKQKSEETKKKGIESDSRTTNFWNMIVSSSGRVQTFRTNFSFIDLFQVTKVMHNSFIL